MKKETSTKNFYAPRYWPAWIVVGLLWLIAQLPYRVLLFIGKFLGIIIYFCVPKLKNIAKTNIDLCFPQLSSKERQKLLKKNFISLGISVFESALAWFGSDKKLKNLAHFHHYEYFEQAKKSGKGIMLLSAHFMTLEIIGRLFALDHEFVVVYREHKIPFVDFLLTKIFRRHYPHMVERKNIRAILKALKDGKTVWYTPDIDAGYYHNVFVPFFGVLASSLIAPAKISEITGAKAIPTAYYRRDDGTGYDLDCVSALENFPSGDLSHDIMRVNQALENAIRKKPEQYIWQYKRFKTRPEGEPRFYKK